MDRTQQYFAMERGPGQADGQPHGGGPLGGHVHNGANLTERRHMKKELNEYITVGAAP